MCPEFDSQTLHYFIIYMINFIIYCILSYGVVVSTVVFDTIDPGSNPGRRCFQVSTVVSTSRCGCEILSSILRLGIFGAVV